MARPGTDATSPASTPPAPDADTEVARLESHRAACNTMELICGYLVGKCIAFQLAVWATMAALGANLGPLPGGRSALVQLAIGMWPTALKNLGLLIAAVLFLRVLFFGVGHLRVPRRRASKTMTRASQLVLGAVAAVLFAAGILGAVFFGVVPAAAVSAAWLGGVTGALIWGGLRWRQGEGRSCAKCGYPQPDAEPGPRCPECGSEWLQPWRAVLGRRTPHRRMMIAGVGALALTTALIATAAIFAARS